MNAYGMIIVLIMERAICIKSANYNIMSGREKLGMVVVLMTIGRHGLMLRLKNCSVEMYMHHDFNYIRTSVGTRRKDKLEGNLPK